MPWTIFDSSSLISPVVTNATIAGTNVIERIIAATKAITTVAAIGVNIFPSTPVRVITGRYTKIMIN